MFDRIELLKTPTSIDGLGTTLGVFASDLATYPELGSMGSQTSSFKSATIRFDAAARTVQIKDFDPMPMPEGLELVAGSPITLRLLDHEGNAKKIQPRTAEVTAKRLPSKDKDAEPEYSTTEFSIVGEPKQKSALSGDDGWTHQVYKFRAYKSHTGIQCDPLPEWIEELARRQRLAWNELAALCRNARRACSTVKVDDIIAFRDEVFLPRLDAYNMQMGKDLAKSKIRCPKAIKEESPEISELQRFAIKLHERSEEGKPVPEGLEIAIIEFVRSFKYDITPLTEFEKEVPSLIKNAIKKYHLSADEGEPFGTAFNSVLKRRRTTKSAIDKGWPSLIYTDSPKYGNWCLGRGARSAKSETLFTDQGVPGLTLGKTVTPAQAGHPNMAGLAAKNRRLRPATVRMNVLEDTGKTKTVINKQGEAVEERIFKSRNVSYSFAVLDHRLIPENSHIIEWKLVHKQHKVSPSLQNNGIENKRSGGYEMWLCITVKVKYPKIGDIEQAAGMDIGWWREGTGRRIATIYNPALHEFRHVHLDLENSPESRHIPFTVNIGPSRWGQRSVKIARRVRMGGPRSLKDDRGAPWVVPVLNIGLLANREFSPGTTYEEKLTEYLKNLSAGIKSDLISIGDALTYFDSLARASFDFAFCDSYTGRVEIMQHRDALKDAAKAIIKASLGDNAPAWLDRAGLTKIHQAVEKVEGSRAIAVVQLWAEVDAFFAERHRFIADKIASRIEKSYEMVAHDIAKWLAGDVQCLAVEAKFLTKLAGKKSNEDPESVKRGAKYRQLASLGELVKKVTGIARKYGITSVDLPVENTTSTCNICHHENEVGIARKFKCSNCESILDQDENAAVNLSDEAMKLHRSKSPKENSLKRAA